MTQPFNIQLKVGSPLPFGATVQKEGVNFAVYAEEADKLSICLFEENSLDHPFQEIELDPLKHRTGKVWHALIEGIPPLTVYGYRLTSNQKNESYLLLDPYAKIIASSSKWGEVDQAHTPYRPLGKIPPMPSFDWEETMCPRIPIKDLIIYEMHVRGFTQHTTSQVQHPGTYLGIIEKIPYLLQLGVNALELMPIHEFNECETSHINPHTQQRLFNYFGYSTVNFFSPMNRYATKANNDQALIEFKTMVRELHKNGIEVILDVVFNHTFEGNQNGPVLSFKGLGLHTYYMINDQGDYLNFSGCGNTFNCNHPVTIELILSSLRYWVTEMQVDGFRFDLASILTRSENGTPLQNPPVLEAITKDPILAETKLIAEAWDAGGLYQVGNFLPGSKRWSEWNGKYRDVVRCFIKGTSHHKSPFATALCGSQDLYGYGRAPTCSINFVTAHDGFSLADLVTYNEKHNLANGEENRDGFDHNDSWNCGLEGHSHNKKIVLLRERQVRNFHLALMVSQGIPLLLMGDEYLHSRDGNNNTWCQDNELNWFLWDHINMRPGFNRFYQLLIKFRKNYPLLRRETFLEEQDISWHGLNPLNPEWENDNRFVAFTLNIPEQGPDLYVAFNASHVPLTLHIPHVAINKSWYWVVNTHNAPPEDFFDEDQAKKLEAYTYRISSYSAIMLRAR